MTWYDRHGRCFDVCFDDRAIFDFTEDWNLTTRGPVDLAGLHGKPMGKPDGFWALVAQRHRDLTLVRSGRSLLMRMKTDQKHPKTYQKPNRFIKKHRPPPVCCQEGSPVCATYGGAPGAPDGTGSWHLGRWHQGSQLGKFGFPGA